MDKDLIRVEIEVEELRDLIQALSKSSWRYGTSAGESCVLVTIPSGLWDEVLIKATKE